MGNDQGLKPFHSGLEKDLFPIINAYFSLGPSVLSVIAAQLVFKKNMQGEP